MRDLKFRAWIKNYNCYADVLGFEQDRLFVQFQSGERAQHRLYVPIEDCVLEQYTGLKDKNGKEIYEGDIVDYNDDGECIGVVKYDAPEFYLDTYATIRAILKGAPHQRVIGNIHEQPEILEINDVN